MLAIVFTDIVGSTALNEQVKDDPYRALRQRHFARCRKLIEENAGCFLDGTQVADLAPLAGLSGLRLLDIRGTRVVDLSPIEHLREVEVRVEDEKRPRRRGRR